MEVYVTMTLHSQVPLLVLANKQDIAGAMTSEEIVLGLGLDSLHQSYTVQPTSLTNGDGVEEGMKELNKMLLAKREKISH